MSRICTLYVQSMLSNKKFEVIRNCPFGLKDRRRTAVMIGRQIRQLSTGGTVLRECEITGHYGQCADKLWPACEHYSPW